MNTISILFITTLSLFMGYTAIRLFSGLLSSFKHGQSLRQSLLARMHILPIARLIDRYGIDINAYVSQLAINDIEKQLRKCEGCDHKDNCINDLGKRSVDINQVLQSCPNSQSFEDYKNK